MIPFNFSEWMHQEYGDRDWPTSDSDGKIWLKYIDYVEQFFTESKENDTNR